MPKFKLFVVSFNNTQTVTHVTQVSHAVTVPQWLKFCRNTNVQRVRLLLAFNVCQDWIGDMKAGDMIDTSILPHYMRHKICHQKHGPMSHSTKIFSSLLSAHVKHFLMSALVFPPRRSNLFFLFFLSREQPLIFNERTGVKASLTLLLLFKQKKK